MTDVTAYEANTHLAKLPDRAAQGERITITRHGVPVAELGPLRSRPEGEGEELLAEFRKVRERMPAGSLPSARELIGRVEH
jgi:prevent-host-death family protein